MLSIEQERAILETLDAGVSRRQTALRFGVSRGTVARVRDRPRKLKPPSVLEETTVTDVERHVAEVRARWALSASLLSGWPRDLRPGDAKDLLPQLDEQHAADAVAEMDASKLGTLDASPHSRLPDSTSAKALFRAIRLAAKLCVEPPSPRAFIIKQRYRRARAEWELSRDWYPACTLSEPAGGLRTAVPAEASTPAVLGFSLTESGI